MQKHSLTKILACFLAMLMLASTLTIASVSAADKSVFGYSELASSADESTKDESIFIKLPSISDIRDFFENLIPTKDEATKDESSLSDYIFGLINNIPTNDEGDKLWGDYVFRIGLNSTYIFDVTIVKYTGSADEVKIPSRILGMAVTAIDMSAFEENQNLTYVEIPYTVDSIGSDAFLNCENLTAVKISRGLKRIDSSAFNGCTNLLEINLPSTLKTIDSSAFSGTGLCEVNIPASVEYVADSAFKYCDALNYISVSERNKNYYSADGALVRIGEEGEGDTLLVYPNASLNEEFTVPETVTNISEDAFSSENLKTVYMSANNCEDKFTSIFSFCSALETIYFDGTMAEWNEFIYPILFSSEDQNVTVICNDGTLVVNEAYYYDEESSDDEASEDEATQDEATKDETTKDESSKDEASKDEATKDEYELGDVNGDGKLNIRDATLIQKYLAKLETLTDAQLKAADYNKDEKVNIKDATALQKKLAHLI